MWQNTRACQTIANILQSHINAELLLVSTSCSFSCSSQIKYFRTHFHVENFSPLCWYVELMPRVQAVEALFNCYRA
jgi:hypothetical protein